MKLLLILTLLQVPIISKYLSYKEATQSVHVGPTKSVSANTPNTHQLALIQNFGKQSFDSLRIKVGSPLYVSSLFRSPALNKLVGGAKNSEHMILGDVVAVDIDQDGKGKIGNRALFFFINENIKFRKLIWEFGTWNGPGFGSPAWVHYSWSLDPAKNIGKVYRATRVSNRIIYTNFNQ